MNYSEILEIVKEYGNRTGFVWLTKGTLNDAVSVLLKYDSTRRYFMSQPTPRKDFCRENETHVEYHNNGETAIVTTTKWKKRPSLQRVTEDVFRSNVEYLLKNGYTICFQAGDLMTLAEIKQEYSKCKAAYEKSTTTSDALHYKGLMEYYKQLYKDFLVIEKLSIDK